MSCVILTDPQRDCRWLTTWGDERHSNMGKLQSKFRRRSDLYKWDTTSNNDLTDACDEFVVIEALLFTLTGSKRVWTLHSRPRWCSMSPLTRMPSTVSSAWPLTCVCQEGMTRWAAEVLTLTGVGCQGLLQQKLLCPVADWWLTEWSEFQIIYLWFFFREPVVL